MQQNLPRLILAGTNSGCGKTTVTCAVLQALVNRGLSVAAAKCGPDYIDPMFHSRIIGAKSSNLDPFFFDENTLRFLLAQNASGCDVTVIEGVMGYYDGLGLTSTRASTYELAQKTVSPVVLVVNARGAALSVLASVRGFLDFLPDDRICGVILNGCTAMTYAPLARVLEDRLGVKACGFLPNLPDCALKSRHLGLVTAAEVADLREKMQRLALARGAQSHHNSDEDGDHKARRGGRKRIEKSVYKGHAVFPHGLPADCVKQCFHGASTTCHQNLKQGTGVQPCTARPESIWRLLTGPMPQSDLRWCRPPSRW